MLIRIVESGPGCVMQPGSLVRIADKRAKHLISIGFAVPYNAEFREDDKELTKVTKANTTFTSIPVVKMEPARLICGCGQVFKTGKELLIHRKTC